MNTENTNQPAKKICSLLRATVDRSEAGLQIEVSSPVDWSAFANKTKGLFKLGGVECYTPKDVSNFLSEIGVKGYFSTHPDFFYENYPNLTLLLARDIQKGVTFNFGLVPIPDSKIELFLTLLKEQAKTIYLTSMKPVRKTIQIDTTTVESERHD